MENEIISYLEMCQREGVNLQRGMNYRLGADYSVILMSVRPNAPYRDYLLDDGATLIYEGHDAPRRSAGFDPKTADQPRVTSTGRLTQNGWFHRAAEELKAGTAPAEVVRVYEKIRSGIWAYNGEFSLVDSWKEHDGVRSVFKFRLEALPGQPISAKRTPSEQLNRRRLIPTAVKLEVWKRDGGRCVKCGAQDELHFDHVIPFSRGGTSLSAENVQLLCARHNISKSDRIR
jgi:hypothetical protein